MEPVFHLADLAYIWLIYGGGPNCDLVHIAPGYSTLKRNCLEVLRWFRIIISKIAILYILAMVNGGEGVKEI